MPSSYSSPAIQGSPSRYRERKEDPDDTGLEIPVYRGNLVTFYLVDRTVTANPLNKSVGQRGAALSVPATHSAPAEHSGTAASPCVPRLARRGEPSPGPGDPAAPPPSPSPQGDCGSPGAGRIVPLSVSGSPVYARGSAPRSPAATAAGTRESRQGRSRADRSPSSAASPRRDPQSSLGTAPGTRRRSPCQRDVLSRRL